MEPAFIPVPRAILLQCEKAGAKTHAKWLKKHCKENLVTTANSQFKPMIAKKIQAIAEKHMPDMKSFRPYMDEDEAGLQQVAYGYKMYLIQDTHFSIMPTQYGALEKNTKQIIYIYIYVIEKHGAVEMRILFEGSTWYVGMPLQTVPGASLAEKIKWTENKDTRFSVSGGGVC